MRIVTLQKEFLQEAARLLKEGGLVAFATETVYGLGANAFDDMAVARIFEAKGRPQFNPLIVHVADLESAEKLVEIGPRERMVAAHFWPGPLTLVLPRKADCPVSALCSAGLPTLAVRVPAHSAAQALLKEAGIPLAAPSANKSGTISPTSPAHVARSLGDDVDLILAGGSCAVGLESTILDLSREKPAVLRLGAITSEEIAALLGEDVPYEAGDTEKPRAPGQLLRHYAPSVPLRMNAVDLEPEEALLAFGPIKFMGIRGGGSAAGLGDDALRNLSESGDLTEAAANLFRMLHELDNGRNKKIAVMNIPDKGLGKAINDRLKRAEAGSK